jgi:O-antigen/teichoic acid export membrane protein
MSDEPSPSQAPRPRRTVGAGATLSSVGFVGTAAAGALLGVVVARILGPSDTGAYNVVSTTFLLLLTVSMAGINIGATYFASNRRWDPGDAFRQVQLGALAAGLACGGAGALVAVLGQDSIFEGVPLGTLAPILVALPFGLSWTFTTAIALAGDHYELFAFTPLAANVTALVLACVLTPLAGLDGAVLAVAGSHVVTAVWLLGWGRRRLPRPRPGWLRRTRADLSRAVSFGFKSYLPTTLQLFNYRADLFVLNAVAAKATVGYYSIALLVTELGALMPRALAAVVLPRVASLDDEAGADEQHMVITKSVRHTIALLPLVSLVVVVGVLAIPLVFGSGFSDAIGPGLILVPGVAAIGLANVLSATVIGRGFPQYALYTALMVTPPTIGLYLLLVPTLDAYGAALASTASYVATGLLIAYYFGKATGLRLSADLLPRAEELTDYRLLLQRARAGRGAGSADSG